MPTVSVIVPTYNRGARLEDAISSVLEQQYEDFELVVVDDGSTDDTAAVVAGFDDPRVRYVAHAENRGGSAARNTGIEESDGEFVAFLDDDDEWLPGKLDRQVGCLRARSDDWVGVYCDYRVHRRGRLRSARRLATRLLVDSADSSSKPEGGEGLIPATLAMDVTLGGTSSLVVRRNAVERIDGFDPTFERHQDWEFLVRLLRVGRLAYVDDELLVKHESGHPPADALRDAKRRLFSKFRTEIAQAERRGWDVTGVHRFALAQHYFMEGRFRRGVRYLDGAAVDPVGLLRAVALGVRARTR